MDRAMQQEILRTLGYLAAAGLAWLAAAFIEAWIDDEGPGTGAMKFAMRLAKVIARALG